MKKGFTLIEIVVALGVVAIISAIGLPYTMDFYRDYLLSSEWRTLLSLLRRAQNSAMAHRYDTNAGISFQADRFIIFQGPSFAARNPVYDEEYPRSGAINISSPAEIIFTPLSGTPNATATIEMNNVSKNKTITINEQGTISY